MEDQVKKRKRSRKVHSWVVRIQATVTKDTVVRAATKDRATERAHELFSAGCDINDKRYEQDTIWCRKMEAKHAGR